MTTLIQRNQEATEEEVETETTLVLLAIFSDLAKIHVPALSQSLADLGLVEAAIDLLMAARVLKPITLKTREELPGDLRTALFGFKATLVKILGNLAFRSREIQDEVRTREGLVLILDSTNIDDANPCEISEQFDSRRVGELTWDPFCCRYSGVVHHGDPEPV